MKISKGKKVPNLFQEILSVPIRVNPSWRGVSAWDRGPRGPTLPPKRPIDHNNHGQRGLGTGPVPVSASWPMASWGLR
jgi:hypothetical protein